ncbi:MAG: DUF1003 domain-containing protein [Bryobacteraceae bacterium]|nr:DUF1003 domain-containing protein [Bryobacteraceae bacterium]
MERNIRTIVERDLQDRIADTVTAFSGSMPFVYLHIAWFLAWVAINSGRLGLPAFDPFPYGLLTMIVSLEAIFLSALVMITQNRQSDEAERRADLDLQIGLLARRLRLENKVRSNDPAWRYRTNWIAWLPLAATVDSSWRSAVKKVAFRSAAKASPMQSASEIRPWALRRPANSQRGRDRWSTSINPAAVKSSSTASAVGWSAALRKS